jgi:hypothetical protein
MNQYQFYNLRVGRAQSRIRLEIRALLSWKPLVLGLCEAIGYDLENLPGYSQVRDRSTKSRANVAVYVREGHLESVKWHDMHETWHRTEGPGEHEARAWAELRVDTDQVLVGHQPPKGTNNTFDAQMEGINFLTARMAPWTRQDWPDRNADSKVRAKERQRIVLADFNRRAGEPGPGPTLLANRIRGAITGARIDASVDRALDVTSHQYVNRVGNVILRSDHKAALIINTKEVA